MPRVRSKDLAEAEDLFEKVCSWTTAEVEALPRFYREKAEEYRRLANRGAD